MDRKNYDKECEMREVIIKRAVKELKEGMYVNLGIGLFMFVVNEVSGMNIVF